MTVHGNFFAALVSFAAVLSACGVQKTVGQNEDKNFSIISVMSFNVRVDMPSDTPNTWTNRKLWVENIMSKEDVIGVQELTPVQYEDLRKVFSRNTLTYSTGKDPASGEGTSCFNAIFYNADRVKVLDHGTFWLSDTPDRPSRGWDGAYVRSCNWAEFEDVNGKLAKQMVEIGLEGDTFTEIKSDLPEFVVIPDSSAKTVKEGYIVTY